MEKFLILTQAITFLKDSHSFQHNNSNQLMFKASMWRMAACKCRLDPFKLIFPLQVGHFVLLIMKKPTEPCSPPPAERARSAFTKHQNQFLFYFVFRPLNQKYLRYEWKLFKLHIIKKKVPPQKLECAVLIKEVVSRQHEPTSSLHSIPQTSSVVLLVPWEQVIKFGELLSRNASYLPDN